MTEAVAIKGRRLHARYTLLDKLGAGGQGEVWLAHDGTRGVDIALKVVNSGDDHDSSWGALEHEYAIASRLDHPAILKVFPPDRSGDVMVLPMELASGGDLRRLRGAGFLEIIPVLLEIAQALEHAHERGVVHRDLKPGNVLFDVRGRARLADFGVAETTWTPTTAQEPPPSDVANVTLPLSAANSTGPGRDTARHGFSPFTASPAQLRGEPPTPADDIYGLGALAYELLSGYPPYYPHFNKKRAIEEPVPELVPTRQIPPLLSALVTRMLDKDPARRPRTMREVIDELDAALNDTLTFDFEQVSAGASERSAAPEEPVPRPGTTLVRPAMGPTSFLPVAGAVRLPALFASDEPAANMSEGPPQMPDWRPDSGRDRRSSNDRRGRRRTDHEPADSREPFIPENAQVAGAAAGGSRDSQQTSRVGNAAPAIAPGAVGHKLASESAGRSGPPGRDPGSLHTPSAAAKVTSAAAAQAAVTPEDARRTASAPEARPNVQSAAPAPRNTSESHSDAPVHAMAGATAGGHFDTGIETGSGRGSQWGHFPMGARPRPVRLKHVRVRRWPWVLLGSMVGAAAAAYFWLPSIAPQDIPSDLAPWIEPIRAAIIGNGAATSSSDGSAEKTAAAAVPPAGDAGAAADTTASGAAAAGTGSSPGEAAGSPATGSRAREGAEASALGAAAGTVAGTASTTSNPAHATAGTPNLTTGVDAKFRVAHQAFERRIALLEGRGAGVWGGRDFAAAKMRAAESVGARDAGNPQLALDRLASASRLLDSVEGRAPQALISQLAAGEKALGTGQQEVAGQAFELARRIDPRDRRASDGQRRAQNMNGVLPLLADAQNAEIAHDYGRAAQDYSQALALDPYNATAKAGQARAKAAFGDDNYAKAVGSGFAALGAGRLDEARAAFVKARAFKPSGAEAAEGMRRVGAALTARGFASIRQRAVGLEAQERWEDAEQAYEDVLGADPSLAFAQEGRARTASRAELSGRLQQLIDRPERLASPGVREEARSLLQTAQAQ